VGTVGWESVAPNPARSGTDEAIKGSRCWNKPGGMK
jgi:hypothetical protein